MLRRSRQRHLDDPPTTETDRVEDRLRETGGWLFEDRAEAGRLLAERLGALDPNTVVVAIPRGGVPVGAAVARHFGVVLDVAIVRKLGVPSRRELALGAVGEGGITVISDQITHQFGISADELREIERRERAEVQRREHQIRAVLPPIGLTGRSVVIVDDGVATGSTLLAACRVVRAHEPQRVVVAVPVAPPGWKLGFGNAADAYLSCYTPEDFMAVGQWYREFPAVDDAEMVHDLTEARAAMGTPADLMSMSSDRPAHADPRPDGTVDHPGHQDHRSVRGSVAVVKDGSESSENSDIGLIDPVGELDTEITVPAAQAGTDDEPLIGWLKVPASATGVVVFAHGSGSGRMSPRNHSVAEVFHRHGIATLLVDLLSVSEQVDAAKAFDIDLLTDRTLAICEHLRSSEVGHLPIALFGGSTGAAAAVRAAAGDPAVTTVVSRGGRIDLAADHLSDLTRPVLLIVGGHDEWVLSINQKALDVLPEGSDLVVVPGASHLFSEPGALERVAERAANWFLGHWSTQPSR